MPTPAATCHSNLIPRFLLSAGVRRKPVRIVSPGNMAPAGDFWRVTYSSIENPAAAEYCELVVHATNFT